MKFFYIIASQFSTVLLQLYTATVLHFSEPISYCDLGVGKKILEEAYRRNRTTISLVPQVKKIKTNMTCYMKSGKIYVFNLNTTKKKPHKNIFINDATSTRGGTLLIKTKEFKVFDSGKNLFIENLGTKPLDVNEEIIRTSGLVSKWFPIIINGKEYYK